MASSEKWCDEDADGLVMEAIRTGDYSGALEALATAYQHKVTRRCFFLLGGFRQEAADIAQEVFLNAYKAMPNFREL
ncbi:MAG: hypothetical protein FJ145_25210 [Deltaproteobacteria bacterium]|nr:hypothetical protein [Deltaproteobacteria bacterium]